MAVRISDDVLARMRRVIKANECAGCGKSLAGESQVRLHQCIACYEKTRRVLSKGKIKKNDLIRKGLIIPQEFKDQEPEGEYEQRLAELM